MEILSTWGAHIITIIIMMFIIPGIHITDYSPALLVALILGFINTYYLPILLLLPLPMNFLSFGISALVINSLLILLIAYVIPGFAIDSAWSAIIFSLILAIVSPLLLKMRNTRGQNLEKKTKQTMLTP